MSYIRYNHGYTATSTTSNSNHETSGRYQYYWLDRDGDSKYKVIDMPRKEKKSKIDKIFDEILEDL